MITNPALLPKIRSRALLNACREMPCTLRVASFIPGHRCSDQTTVVPCHLPAFGKSMGSKVSDLFVAAGCDHCHSLIDGRDNRVRWIEDQYPAAYSERLRLGHFETLARWIGMGLICADMEIV